MAVLSLGFKRSIVDFHSAVLGKVLDVMTCDPGTSLFTGRAFSYRSLSKPEYVLYVNIGYKGK